MASTPETTERPPSTAVNSPVLETERETAVDDIGIVRRVWRNKWIRRMRRVALVGVMLVSLFTGYMYWKYPGFVADTWIQFRQTPINEFIDQYTFLMYFGEYYGKLEENPDTGMYDFSAAMTEHEEANGNDFQHGVLAYHAGEFQTAVEKIEAGIADAGETETKLYWLALAYQRVAEQDNCAKHCRIGDSQQFCALPIVRTHADPTPSRKAAEIFVKLLDDYDSENTIYRWLLNFSYMTLGEFPDGVPKRYLITGDFIDHYYGDRAQESKSRHAGIKFEERAAAMGINTDDCGRGVAVEDFDGDGFLDIITGGTFSSLTYYRNVGGKTFVDETDKSGLSDVKQVHVITAADYDNDGAVDLMVSRPFHYFMFFRNNGDGTFEDVTFASGLLPEAPKSGVAEYTVVTTWGDVNNDGYLDVFLAQFGQTFPFMKGLLSRQATRSRLYLNVPSDAGGLTRGFRDATDEFGLGDFVNDRIILAAPIGDFDHDGWADIFFSTYMGQAALFRNVEGKRFERTELIKTMRTGFTGAFLDINHDGRLDLFHGAAGTAKASTNRAVFGHGSSKSTSAVYFQNENGQFEERPEAFGGGFFMGTMGVGYGDVNNDGAYEFYLGTGNPDGAFVLPNGFFIGQTKGRQPTGMMENASMLQGFGTIQKGHAIVFFDFDQDGDQDIYQSLGGMWPGDKWPNQFFVNESKLNNAWVKIRLRGHETNYYGVGAWIRVDARSADGQPIVRQVYMHNNTGFGSAPYLAHIGLMDAERIERVTVEWPVSKTTKTYTCEIGKFHVLEE